MGTAQSLILQRGYAGTSIDDIIGEAGITKGGFFYHFDGKNDLARNLVLRYLDQDAEFFNQLGDRARSLTEDPLQQWFVQRVPDYRKGAALALAVPVTLPAIMRALVRPEV